MVDYLPCSSNTWELFGINDSTCLGDFFNTLSDSSLLSDDSPIRTPDEIYQEIMSFHENDNLINSSKFNDDLPEIEGIVKEVICEICSDHFDNEIALKKHMFIHTDLTLFKCGICGGDLKFQESFPEGEGKYICILCEEPFMYGNVKGTLQEPLRKIFEYDNSIQLKEQMIVHVADSDYCCGVCHRQFKTYTNYKKHMIVHIESTELYCLMCGGDLKCLGCLPTGEVKFSCNVCNETFFCSNALSKDRREDCGNIYKCNICDKQFSKNIYLEQHLSVHTIEKPYTCQICAKSFKWSGNLKVHMRIHNGEKPFHCDMCSKRFTASNDLRRHKRRHTGEQPYKCETCAMTFKSNSELRQHTKVHVKERPYMCDVCNKRFISASNLKTHLRVHSGESPYQCDECERTFTTSTNLKNHLRIHSGTKPYACNECKRHFSQRSNLNHHMKTHMKDDFE